MQNDNRKIVLFSGTTEGRTLSEMLEKNKIPHSVLVATDYGEKLQPKGEFTHVLEGRKDLDEIKAVLCDAKIVVDATHPYAALVTENIKKAVEGTDKKLIRVLRDSGEQAGTAQGDITYFDSVSDCAGALENCEGNILFTTGSKDLSELCSYIKDKSRVYARVLPSKDSLDLCEKAGVKPEHIIAMFGPFEKELNLAILRQYKINTLITKQSGKTGGFDEKIAACNEGGVKVFCIKRPSVEEGVSPDEALRIILDYCGIKENLLTVNIIGVGMGDEGNLTLEATKAIEASDVIFGAERLLNGISHNRKYPEYLAGDITKRLDELFTSGENITTVSVLFSGDIGFFSGAEKFEKGIREWGNSKADSIRLVINRLPGISSVSFLAARLGMSYQDAKIISLHGRNAESDISHAADGILHSKKSFVLLSSGDDLSRLSEALLKKNFEGSVTAAENLSYENEKITKMSPDEAVKISGKGLFTLYIENAAPEGRLLIPALEDDEFIRNKTPMTKALIRHEVIRLLELKAGDVLYDIGSGTGSIAIEAAGLSGSLRVYSFERDKDAIDVQKQNIEKHGAYSIELIEGTVPDTLDGVPAPDAVFIGGSGGKLEEVLKKLKGYNRKIRVVMTAVSLETMEEISRLGTAEGVSGLVVQQITSSKATQAGGYHLMKTENSVMVASFFVG